MGLRCEMLELTNSEELQVLVGRLNEALAEIERLKQIIERSEKKWMLK